MHTRKSLNLLSHEHSPPLYALELLRLCLLFLIANIQIKTQWTHIGEGKLFEDLKLECEKLPKNIETNFLGSMDNKMLRNFYVENPFDVFLNVSQSEGIPVSVMEALSAGIPVFATNVGGTSELVDDEVGKLIESNFDPKDLAVELQKFHQLNKLKKESIRNAARGKWLLMSNADNVFPEFVSFLLNSTKQRD